MKTQINIAQLLKDCPKGMELYSPIFGKVYLDKVRPHLGIIVATDKYKEEFLYDGRYGMNGECMLFPSKEKTTWEGFQIPFKDGDIVATSSGTWIGITTGGEKGKFIPTYCVIRSGDEFKAYPDRKGEWAFNRLATEEEKAKLFDAIKANGYKWNPETKTLEKLIKPKFKVGDKIIKRDSIVNSWIVSSVSSEYYGLKTRNNSECIAIMSIAEQDEYDLVPDKFDINTLIPFESRVLVRDADVDLWKPAIYGFSHQKGCYVVGGVYWAQYIPYEANKELLGTTNNI